MGKVARAVAARRTALTSPCPPRRPASGAWLRRLHCGQPGSVRSATVSAPPLAPLRAPGLSRTRAGRGLLGIGASWCSACDCPAPPGMLGRSQRQWTAVQRRSEAQGVFFTNCSPTPAPSQGGFRGLLPPPPPPDRAASRHGRGAWGWVGEGLSGAVSEDRARDLRIMRPTRCQLRYHRSQHAILTRPPHPASPRPACAPGQLRTAWAKVSSNAPVNFRFRKTSTPL